MPSAFGSACQPPTRRYPSMVKRSGWSQCAVSTGVRMSLTAAPSLARPPWPRLGRAVQPCSSAILRPTRSAGPAVGPSVAWPSLKPARIRAASRQLTSRSRAPGRGHRVPGAQVVGELAGRGQRLVVEELPVHHHHRRVYAGGVALQVLQADPAVGGDLVVAHAEVLVEFGEDLVAAQDPAHGVRAHADVVLADRAALVHGVEADHPGDIGLGQPERGRAVLDAVLGDVAFLGLDEVQQRQQRRPRLRVLADDPCRVRVETGAHIVAERHYRSTPPITGSRLAIAGIRSATMPPSHIAATDCRCTNDGSRRCTR